MNAAVLRVGDHASFTKTISESDVYLFAGITGDINPAHIDQVYSSGTMFKGRIAHGILVTGLISAVLGTRLPGTGTIYLEQQVKFLCPVHLGDTITATCTVTRLLPEKKRAELCTVCTNQNGAVVVSGQAVVRPPEGMLYENDAERKEDMQL